MKFRLLKQHERDCAALQCVKAGQWNSPWWFPGENVTRDSIGRRNHGWHRWLVVECNSISCHARGIVMEADILGSLPSVISHHPTLSEPQGER